MKSFGSPIPSAKPLFGGVRRTRIRRNPDVSAPVFVKTEHFIDDHVTQSVIDGLRRRVRQLFDAADLGKAKQSLSSWHPPFARVILESDLIPTPAEILNLPGQVRD